MMLANEGLCLILLLGAAGLEGLCALLVTTFPFILGALVVRWLIRATSTEVARHKAYDAALDAAKRRLQP